MGKINETLFMKKVLSKLDIIIKTLEEYNKSRGDK